MKNSIRSMHLFTLAALMMLIAGAPTTTPPANHAIRRPIAATQSLGQALNPDGTLNLRSGFNGSFDARGWQLTTTADGQPRFVNTSQVGTPNKPDIAGDEWWDSEFQIGVSLPGYAATVNAVAIQGNDVYFGGSFRGRAASLPTVSRDGTPRRVAGMRWVAAPSAPCMSSW